MVSGGSLNYGVRMSRGQTVTEIQETRIDVAGGSSSNAYGIYAQGGNWVGSETLELRNVRIKSTSSSQSVGILFETDTSILLNISHSTIEGTGASTAKGIFQGGTRAVFLQHSIVAGSTKTVEVPNHSFSIQATGLFGGPATAGLWNGCMGVWDENGTFYTNTGCPQ